MKQNIIIAGLVVLLVLTGYVFLNVKEARDGRLGSVSVSNEYNATTTNSTSANTHSLIKSSQCTVGSIVVASSSPSGQDVKIWNATTTRTDLSSTTLVTLRGGVSEGTYTFDIACTRGLVIETPASFNGSYVITWR